MRLRATFQLVATLSITSLFGCAASSMDTPVEEETIPAEQAWDTGVAPDSPNGTHQWIFTRALDILRKHADLPGASPKLSLYERPECMKQIYQGLFDADFLAIYVGARWDLTPDAKAYEFVLARATYAPHFYDPDTGKTYTNSDSPTAYEMVFRTVDSARSAFRNGDIPLGCHDLGLGLHYLMDLNQPMHAALFTSKDFPIFLHSNVEYRAMDIEGQYVLQDWSSPGPASAERLLTESAQRAKALWPPTRQAIMDAYAQRGCRKWFRIRDNVRCWHDDDAVDELIGKALIHAQEATAQFLYSVDLP